MSDREPRATKGITTRSSEAASAARGEEWDKTVDASNSAAGGRGSRSSSSAADKEKQLAPVQAVADALDDADESDPSLPNAEEWERLDTADLNQRLLHSALSRLQQRGDPQVEAAQPDPQWLEQLQRQMEAPDSKATLRDFLAAVFQHFADRPCLATRADERSPYAPISYRQVWTSVESIAAGLQASGVLLKKKATEEAAAALGPEDDAVTVGLYGFPSVDWVCCYLACLWLGVCAVPLQTNMSHDALSYVLRKGQVQVLMVRESMLQQLAPIISQAPDLQAVVTMDAESAELTPPSSPMSQQHLRRNLSGSAAATEALAHLRTISMRQLVEMGAGAKPKEAASQPASSSATATSSPSKSQSPSLILFTSGSTGQPKGAVFPERLWRRMMALRRRPPGWESVPALMTLYNLSHISGLWTLHEALNAGGTVHFLLRADMSTFLDDCRQAQPTFFFLVPRLLELAHDHYQALCMRMAVEERQAEVNDAIRQRAMRAMRHSYFGSRLVLVQTGSAVTQPQTLDWFRRCFLAPIFDIYGQTESLGISRDGHILRPDVEAYKLVSVPELGYTTDDRPYPRGELCVRAIDLIPEYYRDAAATAKLRDAEGFLHTGDIVAETGPDRIVYVDRASNTLKLAQGEFVALAQLENIFTTGGPFIAQIFLHGRSDRSYLLAALIPHWEELRARLAEQGEQDEPAAKALLRSELQRIADAAGLAGWEVPRDFIVESEPWSKANGMLTDSDKFARSRLRERYAPKFAAMHDDIERRTRQAQLQQAEVSSGGDARTPRERLLSAVTGVLGCEVAADSATRLSFVRLGGDSLSGSRLADLLKESCGVAPSVAMLLDPKATLAELAEWMEAAMGGRQARESWRPTFRQVHPEATTEARVVRAADLDPERFFSAQEIQQCARLHIAPGPCHVLLTGANGFLGRFLLIELLQRGLQVTAIVRASSDEEALKRLHASFGDLSPLLVSMSSHGNLRVLSGDLMRGGLGLAPEVFDELCVSVDTVLHNGALVNHYLSYEQLWEPNVLGTVEIARFAMRERRKQIVFMSSVAVGWRAKGAGQDGAVLETQSAAELWPERAVTDQYASGYGTSKWASEVVLGELSRRCGVPVTLIRSSMVLAHPDLRGQVNRTDFVTRLFVSLVRTGCRPHSFYKEPEGEGDAAGSSSESAGGSRPKAHFDGVPVNVSAAGIVASLLPVSSRRSGAWVTLHAVNAHHADGVSLDSFADWMSSDGYSLETLRPYARWFAELERRLGELPREQRDSSAYPIRHQWAAPIEPDAEPTMDNTAFTRLLADHTRFGQGVPVLDERFIHTYLAHMRDIGLIDPPPKHKH